MFDKDLQELLPKKKMLITTRSYLGWERDDDVLRVRSADGGAELSYLTIWVIITFC